MTVTVRLFASLRERMGFAERTVEAPGGLTVGRAWELATGGQAMPERVLAAVNREYARVDTPVKDGDEIAFFPPVTGG